MKKTSATDSITASQLISRAQSTLSMIAQASSLLKSSKSLDPKKGAQLLQELEQAWQDAAIERAILSTSKHKKQMASLVTFLNSAMADVEERPLKEMACVGANRSGKSYGFALATAIWLMWYAKHQSIVWCISPNEGKSLGQQKMLWDLLPKRVFGEREWGPELGFGGKHHIVPIDVGDRQIVVKFLTEAQWISNPRSFEQEPVDLIWIDESIQHAAYQALLPRTIDKGAMVLLSCIPDQAWLFEEFEEAEPGSRKYFQRLAMKDNPFLPKTEIESALASWSQEEIDVRVYGKFRFIEGVVYREFIKELSPAGHLVKPFEIPDSWPKYRALDWGNMHPTACLWAAVAPNECIYIYREYKKNLLSVLSHTENILAMSGKERYAKPMIFDPAIYSRNQSNVTSIADEFHRCGLPGIPGPRSSRQEPAMIQRVKRRLMGRDNNGYQLKVFDNCPELIRELRLWKYKTNRDNKPLDSDMFEDRNNDLLDCLKYLVCFGISYTPLTYEVINAHGE